MLVSSNGWLAALLHPLQPPPLVPLLGLGHRWAANNSSVSACRWTRPDSTRVQKASFRASVSRDPQPQAPGIGFPWPGILSMTLICHLLAAHQAPGGALNPEDAPPAGEPQPFIDLFGQAGVARLPLAAAGVDAAPPHRVGQIPGFGAVNVLEEPDAQLGEVREAAVADQVLVNQAAVQAHPGPDGTPATHVSGYRCPRSGPGCRRVPPGPAGWCATSKGPRPAVA